MRRSRSFARHVPAAPVAIAIALAVLLTACSSDDESSGAGSSPATSAAPLTSVDVTVAGESVAPESAPDSTPPTEPDTAAPTSEEPATTASTVEPETLACDVIGGGACLLPWPNDAFTRADATAPTGRRLAIDAARTPANADGTRIDVSDQNRADGFSPGSALLVHIPDLDLAASGIAPSTDIGASLEADAPIVLWDVDDGERWPYWAELDAQSPDDDERLLIIHPAVSLHESHRYVVALQNLRTSAGAIAPAADFVNALLPDADNPGRAAHLDAVVGEAVAAGADESAIYMAWDFTVASAESLAGRLLHMRDEAYASVEGTAPVFTITSTVEDGGVRAVEGTIAVPNFLTGAGEPGAEFDLGTDGLPARNATNPDFHAPFLCLVPTAPSAPVPAVVFGHGLLGSRAEINGLRAVVGLGLLALCATDEIGMAGEDIPVVAANLADLSTFNRQADRMQQGLLDMQFLGRAINADDGFVSDPAFQAADGSAAIAPGRTAMLGNSQGGILGGAASAISTEWTNVALGVPGINYSLLVTRSSDWPQFQSIFDQAYTDPFDRVLALQLAQLLWDRGENDAYAEHLTADTYPGIEPKKVLLIGAFGDHQVANVATDVLARTIGATLFSPGLAPGRSDDVEPFWGIDATAATTIDESAYVMWDYGNPAPPAVNLPPTDPEYGEDPHGKGADEPRVIELALRFLATGEIEVPCDGACISDTVAD